MDTAAPQPPALTPTLTPTEVNAALTWIEPGARSVLQLARDLDLTPRELLDIVTRPHVATFIEAVRPLCQQRAEIVAAHEHADARTALVKLAKNEAADPWLRLRAATAVLRGDSTPSPRRSAGTPTVPMGTPTVPGGVFQDTSRNIPPMPAPPIPSAQRATLRAMPTETPLTTPTEIFTTTLETLQNATSEDPETLTPIQNLCALPLRTTTPSDFAARTQLHRAAGAELADHTLINQNSAPTLRATFRAPEGPLTFDFTCHNHGAATPTWRLTTITLVPNPAPDDTDDLYNTDALNDASDFDIIDSAAFTEAPPPTAGHPP